MKKSLNLLILVLAIIAFNLTINTIRSMNKPAPEPAKIVVTSEIVEVISPCRYLAPYPTGAVHNNQYLVRKANNELETLELTYPLDTSVKYLHVNRFGKSVTCVPIRESSPDEVM